MGQNAKLITQFEVIRDCPVLHLDGTLDATTSIDFRHDVSLLFATGYKSLVLDCGNLEFMDSSGIGALIQVIRSLKDQGGKELWMARCNQHVRTLLQVTQLDSQIQCAETLGTAIDSWRLQPVS